MRPIKFAINLLQGSKIWRPSSTATKYQAESERKRIIERQQQGIALAKQQGKYHGRKPQYAKDDPRLQHAFKLYQTGMSDVDVARNIGIKRTTFIRYRKKFNIQR